jgi:hypothetical protein
MFSARGTAAVSALVSVMVLTACAAGDVTTPPGSEARLVVRAELSGTAVATVVVEVTAPDITTPLVFNIPIVAGVASGTVTIPAGSNRTVAIRAYDAGGVETHSGSITITVQAGSNPSISITLAPLSGGVEIHATLGSFAVVVTPPSNTLSVRGSGGLLTTVPLTATILDEQGRTVTDTVSWATHDPGVASVSGNDAATPGLVAAVGVGQTEILATYHGAVGSAAITVGP